MVALAVVTIAAAASFAVSPPPPPPPMIVQEHAPDSKRKVRELLQQAAGAVESGNPSEAETLLRAALDLDAGDAAATLALGKLLCENDGGAEGLALLYHAVELEPKSGEATVALVDELLALRDACFAEGDASNADANLARAHDALDRAAKQGAPPTSALELRRVRVLTRSDCGGGEAFERAKKLVAADAEDQELQVALVEAASAAKAFDDALAFYAATEMEPWIQSWFTAAVKEARAHYAFNHYENDEQAVNDYLAAGALFLESARLHPEVFDAASERASFERSWAGWVRFLRQQRAEEAWELFVAAWGRDSGNASAIEGMSWICQRLYEAGELEKTREYARQACVIAPERSDFWNNYGLVCRDTGQFEESFRAYRRAMALSPDDGRIVNDCALILLYHLHRDLDLCERWFIRAEDLARAKLEQAKRDQDEGQITEQRGVVGDALANLARLFAEQGRMQESAQEWSELRDLDPGRPELPENGGQGNVPGAANPPPPPPNR